MTSGGRAVQHRKVSVLDDALSDRLLAGIAARSIQLPIMLLAVGLTLVLNEFAAGEWLRAVCAHEVLRVEGLVQGMHHLADDHFA